MANETITAAKGFLAAGVAAGVKASGKRDLGLLYCPEGATAAAMFTTNRIVAATVEVCREHAASGQAHAVLVNSGNANACTGPEGLAAARRLCDGVGTALKIDPRHVLPASTGIIGVPLPIHKIDAGIGQAVDHLRDTARAGMDFARAIMTTDTRPKQAMRRITISGCEVTIAGTTKGAGMIGPNMATTICVAATDCAITPELLNRAWRDAIGASLNRLVVDGHQSTNDTAIILASGAAGNRIIRSTCPRYRAFARVLAEVTGDLARQMALDAEGATRMFTVEITGAATAAEARQAARAVAGYDLVKCAVHGADPNWGRIICAVGSSGVRLDPQKLTCKIGGITVFRNGRPTAFDRHAVSAAIAAREHTIQVDLGVGKAEDSCYGCDLSRDYVKINADYHT